MKRCDNGGITAREAVKMVSDCQRERLPYVLAILKREGYEFPDTAVELAQTTKRSRTEQAAWRRKKERRLWYRSDDPTVALLREAYIRGVSFTDISNMSGVNRTVMYEYLKGTRAVPEQYREELSDTIRTILDKMPDVEEDENVDG